MGEIEWLVQQVIERPEWPGQAIAYLACLLLGLWVGTMLQLRQVYRENDRLKQQLTRIEPKQEMGPNP